MREIKFRAWDGKEMCYMEENLTEPYWNCQLAHFLDEHYGCDIMQYTGLKDKNGNEIYEGDIIQYKHYYAHWKWWSTTSEIPQIEADAQRQRDNFDLVKNVVRFENGGFVLDYPISGKDIHAGQFFKRGTSHCGDYEEKSWDFEVIGNIYENPELLEGI